MRARSRVEQLAARLLRQCDVLRVGADEVDVLVGGVFLVPRVAALGDEPEEPALRDFGAEGLDGLRRPGRRASQADGDVVLLRLEEEGVRVLAQHVLDRPDRDRAAVAQDFRRPDVPQLRLDPVVGAERDECVVAGPWWRPGLEIGHDDLDAGEERQLPLSRRGERRPQFDAGDAQAAAGQRKRRFARATADLDDARSGLQAGDREEIVEQRVRIRRPRALIQLRHPVERRASQHPVHE